jgi:Spy/CpxP family protein refolding chaperone
MLLQMDDEIGLTDAQEDRLQEMMFEFQTQMVDQQAKIKKARIQLQALRMNDGSENEVFAAIDKLSDLKAEAQKLRYSHRKQVLGVLTEEQLDKVEDLQERRMKDGPNPGNKGKRGGRGWSNPPDDDEDDG